MRRDELARALATVESRIDNACAAANRERSQVRLLVVTKFFPASDVVELIDLGRQEFGESREPEASRKYAEVERVLADRDDDHSTSQKWEMIGRVQRNKAKSVVRWADSVQSVDSARLARTLQDATAQARSDGARSAGLRVLIQASLDGDIQRGGVELDNIAALAEEIDNHPDLELSGLMAIAPLSGEVERWCAIAADAHQQLQGQFPHATELSLGMTDDLEHAIAYGSTCVRVGTAIMGPRPILSP